MTEYEEIIRRLQTLEHHMINLIVPLQGLSKLLQNTKELRDIIHIFNQPLKIDDDRLVKQLEFLWKKIEEVQLIELSQKIGEIKFMGQRLTQMEKSLKKLEEEGIRKRVDLEFKCDGYELVKKPVDYNEDTQFEKPEEKYLKLQLFLGHKLWTVMKLRLGLDGDKGKTYVDIGYHMDLSKQEVSRLYAKACRYLRSQDGRRLIERSNCPFLRKIL